ncbi:SDR family NAD(P)-dependent oxidoreductase [Amycolatopsis sp. H6(2020)]|nr:SDR family NAD(P)-dependent oxidoreductase [Amycolatopsis sp. H6(2020)]
MGYHVITGASAGIGAAAALELTRRGHRVLALGRSPAKLADVHRRMLAAAPSGVEVPEPLCGDLASLAEVRRLAGEILDRCDRIDVLANNAGVQPSRRRESPDGFEFAFAVNHLAPFLLTHLVLERIADSGGRVVTTSSSTHWKADLDLADLPMTRRWRAGAAYSRSKLANILFTAELRRRTGIAASSFHPGDISTDLNRDSPFVRIVKPFERFVFTTPDKGAETLVWLATDPEGAAPSARYYADRKPAETAAAAQDDDLARRLWEISTELTGLGAGTHPHRKTEESK